MQAQQMADCLQRLAPMLDQDQAAVVLRLAKAIGPIGPKPFGAVGTKISKHLVAKGHRPAENQPSALLSRMAEVSLAAGSAAIVAHRVATDAANPVSRARRSKFMDCASKVPPAPFVPGGVGPSQEPKRLGYSNMMVAT